MARGCTTAGVLNRTEIVFAFAFERFKYLTADNTQFELSELDHPS